MTDFLDTFKARAEAVLAPHLDTYGEDAPTVKVCRQMIALVEAVVDEVGHARISTAQAAAVTGWSDVTLQKYARMKLNEEMLPRGWRALDVVETPKGFAFLLATIPANPRQRAA